MKLGGVVSVCSLVVGTAVIGCGGASKPSTPQCSLNSDCTNLPTPGLICALGYCVTPCKVSSDCPNSERCVIVSNALAAVGTDGGTDAGSGGTGGGGGGGAGGTDGSGGGGASGAGGSGGSAGGTGSGGASAGGASGGTVHGTACQAPETVKCQYNSQCKTPLVCGSDQQCRDMCEADVDCPMQQVCTSKTKLCADPSIDKDYDQATNDFVTSSGGSGGSTSEGGAGGSTGAGGGAHTDGAVDGVGGSVATKPDAATGPLGFVPSNLSLDMVDAGAMSTDGGLWGAAADITISNSNANNGFVGTPVTIAMNDPDETQADVYFLRSLTVDSTASLNLTGPRPIILAVLTTVDIQGPVVVAAGGFASPSSPGPGAGHPTTGVSGGGGGSYCGVGGHGSAPSGPAAVGGAMYGNQALTPVLGGSAGGGVQVAHAGGGALQIVAGTSIRISSFGSISAPGLGGGGECDQNGQPGGGSGGAILLEAPTVTIMGKLAANGGGGTSQLMVGASGSAARPPAPGGGGATHTGGGGGSAGAIINGGNGAGTANATEGCTPGGLAGGGGGAGRIRINTATGSATIGATAIVSPSLTTTCATQGQIGS